jgi:uncharacterized protein (TIGR03083 family)
MVDTSDVANLDPFDLLDVESERVARFFDNLDEQGWTKDTRCEGWRVRELLSHMDGVEVYHRACLDDAIPQLFEEAKKAGATGFDNFNDWIVAERAKKPTQEVISSWRAANADVRKRLRERGLDGALSSSVGPYPVGLMALHIASEYATHGDDMDVPVDEGEKAGRTAWREKVSLFALKETEKQVAVEKTDAGYKVTADGEEVTLSPEDFVEAATARLKTISPKLQDALRALA